MDATLDPRLIALACMLGVWLAYAWMIVRRQRALPPATGEARWFHLSSSLWWMGPLLLLLGPGFMLFMLLLVPVGAKDVVPVVFIALFMGGFSPVVGVMLMRSRYRLDDRGLVGYSVWGMPVFVAWHNIQDIKLSSASQNLRFAGGPIPVHVLIQLHELPAFIAEIERRLPHLPMPGELQPDSRLRNDGERLVFEGHWQGIYDTAGRWFWGSVLTVGASAFFLAPYPPAWLWAGLGGASMVAFPILRRLIPKPRKYSATLGNLLQGMGYFLAVIVLLPAAYRMHTAYLGGEEAIDEVLWLVMLLQHIGLGLLVFSVLILAAKARWPDRYARDRMPSNNEDAL